MTPPPMIRTFLTDPPAKRIAIVQQERALGRDEGMTFNRRNNLSGSAIEPLVRGLEAAADDALLHPGLALGELAVGRQAGELRARAGAAGRAVVGLARAEHEVARSRRGGRRPEELDVIDVGIALRVEHLADAPARLRQHFHVLHLQDLAMVLHEEEPVPAPGYVSSDLPELGHVDSDGLVCSPA